MSVYHTGFLAVDRAALDANGKLTPEAIALDKLATDLFEQAERGEVVLHQRRLGPGLWEYHCR